MKIPSACFVRLSDSRFSSILSANLTIYGTDEKNRRFVFRGIPAFPSRKKALSGAKKGLFCRRDFLRKRKRGCFDRFFYFSTSFQGRKREITSYRVGYDTKRWV